MSSRSMTDKTSILSKCRDKDCCYDSLLAQLSEELAKAKELDQEEKANELWALKECVHIHALFLQTYNLLQEHNFYDAWCKAEQVEICSLTLKRNNPRLFNKVRDLAEKTSHIQALYPYKLFSSYVAEITREECSICHKIRSITNPCRHRVGKVYSGELCLNIVKDFKFIGVDLVTKPVNKYCVVFLLDSQGQKIDHYNYSYVARLADTWEEPFQHWTCEQKNSKLPKSRFPHLNGEDMCPCGSGRKYAQCCELDNEGIKHTTYHFTFY